MVKRPILELTTDLPEPPAPHLGPTLVRVDNPELRRAILIVRLVIVAIFGLPGLPYLFDPYIEPLNRVFAAAAGLLVFICAFSWIWRPERVRAGVNWVSAHGGRHWVELDKLTALDKTGRTDRWVFYDSRNRRELLDADSLRHCPILFDLLMRGVMRAEEAGTMRTKRASERLMDESPPGYRRPERWDSDW
jgi:hypothetical protein